MCMLKKKRKTQVKGRNAHGDKQNIGWQQVAMKDETMKDKTLRLGPQS